MSILSHVLPLVKTMPHAYQLQAMIDPKRIPPLMSIVACIVGILDSSDIGLLFLIISLIFHFHLNHDPIAPAIKEVYSRASDQPLDTSIGPMRPQLTGRRVVSRLLERILAVERHHV